MTVWALTWSQCRRVRKLTRGRADLLWLYDLSTLLQVSFVSFAVGGAFLNLSTFDLFWHLVAISIIAHSIMRKTLAAGGPAAVSRQGTRIAAARPSAPAAAEVGGGMSGFLKRK
jgi:hypothetical protein